jgi:hypothetical protein
MDGIFERAGPISNLLHNKYGQFVPSVAGRSYSPTTAVGLAYAILALTGIFLIASISVVLRKQRKDLPAIIGMCLIVTGVVVKCVFSKKVSYYKV